LEDEDLLHQDDGRRLEGGPLWAREDRLHLAGEVIVEGKVSQGDPETLLLDHLVVDLVVQLNVEDIHRLVVQILLTNKVFAELPNINHPSLIG